MADLPKLPQLHIQIPCSKSWDELDGGAQRRFCAQCQKHVCNFQQMTSQEVQAIIRSGNEVCARICRNEDGRVITRSESRPPSRIDWKRITSWLAATATTLALAGCSRKPTDAVSLTPVEPTVSTATVGQIEMGDVCIETTEQTPIAALGRISVPASSGGFPSPHSVESTRGTTP